MTKKKNSSVEDITVRRIKLREIIDNFAGKGIHASRPTLFKEFIKFHKVSYSTFQRDWASEVKGVNFIREIGESTYSAYVEEMFYRIDNLHEQYSVWLENPPTITKQLNVATSKFTKDGKPLFDVKKVTTETVSKTTITRMIKELLELQVKVLSGDIVDTSMVLIQEGVQNLKQRNQELEAKIRDIDGNDSLRR